MDVDSNDSLNIKNVFFLSDMMDDIKMMNAAWYYDEDGDVVMGGTTTVVVVPKI